MTKSAVCRGYAYLTSLFLCLDGQEDAGTIMKSSNMSSNLLLRYRSSMSNCFFINDSIDSCGVSCDKYGLVSSRTHGYYGKDVQVLLPNRCLIGYDSACLSGAGLFV